MPITFQINTPITTEQFIALLINSSLANRRPVEDIQCMEGMITNSNLVVSAWDGNNLIGIARSMTDFHYACYLSDLAIDKRYQGQGIGKELQAITQAQLGSRCKLILIAAPDADSYYEHMGYERNPRCWILERHKAPKT